MNNNYKYYCSNLIANIYSLFCFSLVILISSLISCTNFDQNKEYKLSLIKDNDSLFYVQIKTDSSINRWKLPYPVYHFQTGDINNDGLEEILVGVVKTTRFDPVIGNRLFIFKNYNGLVRPLWLGSRLGQPIVNFKFVKTNAGSRVRSIEQEKSGKYLVAEYKWRKFGLEFTQYISREIQIDQAMIELKK